MYDFQWRIQKGWGECEISYKVKIKLNHMPSGKENLQLASPNNGFFRLMGFFLHKTDFNGFNHVI